MRAAVVYESMFGNTRRVAAAVAEGLAPYGEVCLFNVNDAGARDAAASADILVLGGPTHAHGMSRPASRREAPAWANDIARHLVLEPAAPGTGVREWIDTLEHVPPFGAAFDTRMDIARMLSGAASGRISDALTRRGAQMIVPAASMLVDKTNVLLKGELAHAHAWGVSIGDAALHPASPGRAARGSFLHGAAAPGTASGHGGDLRH